MASVDNAASTDGAPPLALFRLEAKRTLKAVIGSWLNRGAKLVEGRACGARVEINRLLASSLARGAGIVMISSCLSEVYDLACALRVLRSGRIVASHGHKDASMKTIPTEAIGI